MRTLFILIVVFLLALTLNAVNKKEIEKTKKDSVNLIFSNMYKHKFNSL